MVEKDKEYLEARAEAELKLAKDAEHPAAVRAHYLLADLYLDQLHGDAERSTSQDPENAGKRKDRDLSGPS